MQIKRTVREPQTVTISCTVASGKNILPTWIIIEKKLLRLKVKVLWEKNLGYNFHKSQSFKF